MSPSNAASVIRQENSVDEARCNFVAGAVTFAATAGAAEGAHAQAPQNLRFQNPPGLPPPRGYSQVVEVTGPGRTVYIAGQIGIDASGKVANGFRAQATQVFENLKVALAAVGASFDHVVKLSGYMTDIPTQLPILREVRSNYLKEDTLPAATVVQVVALADPRFLLEIEVVAFLPPRG
jgi:enamine deaminase RidA (YjgF/YER057c/UK114 family)